MIAATTILALQYDQNLQIIPLMINICYPVYEVLFSIVRKTLREGHHPTKPDGVHLHMLFYKRYFRKLNIKAEYKNSLTSVVFWIYQAFCSIVAINVEQSTAIVQFFMLIICGVIYYIVYIRIAKFRWKLA
jgi:UDP-N-acetylmuramyl pentapeptide phosphotransferase/UDP-N-acetylglucosamine-1-phosphate transferase